MRSPAAAATSECFWRSRSWWAKAGSVTAGVWGATGLAFASTVVVARSLGATGYGAVVLAGSAVSVVATFLDVTLEEAVVHHGSRYLLTGQGGSLRRLLRTAIVLDFLVGAVVAAAIAGLAGVLATVAGGIDPVLVRLATLTVLAQTIDGTAGAALLVAGRPDLRAWSTVVGGLARLLLVVGLAPHGAEAVLLGYAVAAFVGSATQAAFAYLAMRPHLSATPGAPTDEIGRLELLRFGLHTSFTTTVLAVRGGLLTTMVGAFAGPAAAGIFDVALLPVSVADVTSAPIRLLTYPEHARLFAERRLDELRHALRLQTIAGLTVGAVGSIVGWYAIPGLISLLYSDEFAGAVTPARILLIVAILHLGVSWSKTLAAAAGQPAVRTKVAIVDLAVLAVLMVAFGRHGASGAAVALTISTVFVALTWVVLGERVIEAPARLQSTRENSKLEVGQP